METVAEAASVAIEPILSLSSRTTLSAVFFPTPCAAVIDLASPDAMQSASLSGVSSEKLFYNNNAKKVIDVAQARGVITLSAQNYGVDIFEYTPLQVKQAVVGYGRAEKKQVQEMTRLMLGLAKIPKPDDTADALA